MKNKWKMDVQARSRFGLRGCGLSRGGHVIGGVLGKSWSLFLPGMILTVTKEWGI